MANITFDTDDYYDDDTLKEMIEQETKFVIGNYVRDMLHKQNGVDDFVCVIAKRYAQELLNECIPTYKQDVAEKVKDIISQTEDYTIRYSEKFKEVMNECIEQCRPMIKSNVESVCAEKIDANYLVDCVCDEFYNMLSKMLSNKILSVD